MSPPCRASLERERHEGPAMLRQTRDEQYEFCTRFPHTVVLTALLQNFRLLLAWNAGSAHIYWKSPRCNEYAPVARHEPIGPPQDRPKQTWPGADRIFQDGETHQRRKA